VRPASMYKLYCIEFPPLSKRRGVNEPLLPVLSRMSHEADTPRSIAVHVTVTVPVLSRAVALEGSYGPNDNAVADTLQLCKRA
jgi:hypothetical protein